MSVRIKKDIRVTGVLAKDGLSDAYSNYEEYNTNSINSSLTLPNSNSKITYEVDVTNFGNVDMAIASISGLPSNLKYSISNYDVRDKVCDDADSTKCKLGAKKTLNITIEYADGGYDASNTNYLVNLNFDFKRYFSITYKGIVNNNYPDHILENESMQITFTGYIPNTVSATGLTNYSFDTPVLSISDPTENVIISGAIYSRHYDELVFDGTNYVDTGVYLFNAENINKNFEISFNISADTDQVSQATIVNAMQEVSPYPGFVLRVQSNKTHIEFNSPKIKTKTGMKMDTTNKILLKRLNDIYYIQVNDGNLEMLGTYDYGVTFDVPVVLGASPDSDTQRFFKGTLTNVNIEVTEPEFYTVVFNSNGGTGSMPNQTIRKDETLKLSTNLFEREDYIFDNWNTKADGSGTSYTDEQSVTNLANPNESITLYAIWMQGMTYKVNYNANGGTGSMEMQDFEYGQSQNIRDNTFAKQNGIFLKWNTEPDGSGTDYMPGQSVKNLTKTANDIVQLYAIWSNTSYAYSGEYVFTGSNYIDTGVYLFSDATVNRDFEISFEIVQRNTATKQATLMSAMDESGSPWPGIVYRILDSANDQISTNANGSIKVENNYANADITKVSIKRTNKILYVSFNDGDYTQLIDMTNLAHTFDVPLTFGASLNAKGSPQRYFKGTLRNMNVTIY